MTHKQFYIVMFVLIVHTIISIIGTRKLVKSVILTRRQKWMNISLLWAIPFFWYLLVDAMHKRNPGSHEVPVKDDVSNNPFHESGKGAPGANIRF